MIMIYILLSGRWRLNDCLYSLMRESISFIDCSTMYECPVLVVITVSGFSVTISIKSGLSMNFSPLSFVSVIIHFLPLRTTSALSLISTVACQRFPCGRKTVWYNGHHGGVCAPPALIKLNLNHINLQFPSNSWLLMNALLALQWNQSRNLHQQRNPAVSLSVAKL